MASPDRKELQAKWKTEVEVPTLSLADVAKHNTKTDLWIVIHGKVYDVTKYARDHPGGAEALIEVGGTDSTSAYEDVGHSEDAREIMHQFLVGSLAEAADSQTPTAKPKVQLVRRGVSNEQPKKSALSGLTPQIELAAVAVGTIAVVFIARTVGLPSSNKSHAGSKSASGAESHGGFVSGFLWATTVCAAMGAVGYRYISKAMSFDKQFAPSSFPAHMHASKLVRSTNRPAGVLMPQEYQKFPLIRRDELSKDTVRLVFALPAKTTILGLPIGQHVAIRGYFDDDSGHHTVTRSYTPVSNNKDLGRLELVIKLYPDGQLTGKYLTGLKLGDEVEFRGPKGAMRYRKGFTKRLGMVAGGTGITPMYQLIRAICEDKTDDTKVSLVYANKSPDDILLRNQLERYQKLAPSKFKIYYIVDNGAPGWTGGVGRVTKETLQEHLPLASADTKILLCGPPGMINATKKNLGDLGFEQPGAVSKLTDQVFLF
ncbi:hypothetical protein M409DRAFT_64304 [Zasmidium cellare ATCC 36951]|uniref:Cytochrome-b5 reductase n=1 Tax=Zasmidium cellare ATCC 36951 TaxID=1080233 RepID=A0A6A6CXV7_ZASCE|nr:uncharacterized protein M409DRAFT_64304 [Zasmidium cellare ATCC 36951]KAF2170639.1 hypothetical protein M409DRAFT_64304 [Zasmidium cellare ATCC 36951]